MHVGPWALLPLLATVNTQNVGKSTGSTAGCPPLKGTAPAPRPKNCPNPKTVPAVKGTLRDNDCLIGGIMGGDFFNGCYAPDMAASGSLPSMMAASKKSVADWSGGSGPYKAQFFTDPSLPKHTIYAPKTVDPARKLPVIVWANGACGVDGSSFTNFLTEIASHGFLIIANGAPKKIWGKSPKSNPMGGNKSNEKSRASWLTVGIDWAEKGASGGKFGVPDNTKVAAAGQSCGGVEAYSASVYDPRVKVIGIFNTGVIDPGRRWMLKDIKQPIGYFYGGKTDFADHHINQDYAEIPATLPAMMSYLDVGHLGTYFEQYGGRFGKAALGFFKWHLKGEESSKKLFFDKSSVLYKDGWKINTSHWK